MRRWMFDTFSSLIVLTGSIFLHYSETRKVILQCPLCSRRLFQINIQQNITSTDYSYFATYFEVIWLDSKLFVFFSCLFTVLVLKVAHPRKNNLCQLRTYDVMRPILMGTLLLPVLNILLYLHVLFRLIIWCVIFFKYALKIFKASTTSSNLYFHLLQSSPYPWMISYPGAKACIFVKRFCS